MEEYILLNQDYILGKTYKKNKYSHRLEQFLSHPNSILKNNTFIDEHIGCGKMDAVQTILNNTFSNEKVIIYSRYKDVLFQYSKFLNNIGYKAITITGDDRIDTNKKINLFKKVISIKYYYQLYIKQEKGLT
jgi:ERCC4-related helicase